MSQREQTQDAPSEKELTTCTFCSPSCHGYFLQTVKPQKEIYLSIKSKGE